MSNPKCSEDKPHLPDAPSHLVRQIRSRGGQSYQEWAAENLPADEDAAICILVRKALARESFDDDDRKAVPALLKRFADMARAVRWASKDKSSDGDIATFKLIEETYKCARQLSLLPTKKVQPIASEMSEFPLLVSPHPGLRRRNNEILKRLEVGTRVEVRCDLAARWKDDPFAEAASELVQVVQRRLANCGDDKAQVKAVTREMISKSLERQELYDALSAHIKSESDVGIPSRVRQRVKDNIEARLLAMLGLRKST